MNYNELFINKDDVLLIRKTLVKVLGNLNEAVVLNQIHYWLEINKKADKNFRDGRYWILIHISHGKKQILILVSRHDQKNNNKSGEKRHCHYS